MKKVKISVLINLFENYLELNKDSYLDDLVVFEIQYKEDYEYIKRVEKEIQEFFNICNEILLYEYIFLNDKEKDTLIYIRKEFKTILNYIESTNFYRINVDLLISQN